MNPFATHLLYKNVIPLNTIENANSAVILTPDFSDIQFTVLAGVYGAIGTIVGTFKVGEVITGGTSSATGRVVAVTSTHIVIGDVGATPFQNAETITGTTSGATAVVSALAVPNFTMKLFKSNQDSDVVPDPTLPLSPTNQYSQIAYSDEQGGVNYDVAHPFSSAYDVNMNPLPYTQKVFKAITEGAMWIFLVATFSGGALLKCDIDLFNNK